MDSVPKALNVKMKARSLIDEPLIVQTLVTIAVALIGSSGVWGVFTMIIQKRNVSTLLLIRIAQHLLVTEAYRLLEQGYMSTDEYKNITKGLYEPYKLLGGNGLAEKLINDVSKLPMRSRNYND